MDEGSSALSIKVFDFIITDCWQHSTCMLTNAWSYEYVSSYWNKENGDFQIGSAREIEWAPYSGALFNADTIGNTSSETLIIINWINCWDRGWENSPCLRINHLLIDVAKENRNIGLPNYANITTQIILLRAAIQIWWGKSKLGQLFLYV